MVNLLRSRSERSWIIRTIVALPPLICERLLRLFCCRARVLVSTAGGRPVLSCAVLRCLIMLAALAFAAPRVSVFPGKLACSFFRELGGDLLS